MKKANILFKFSSLLLICLSIFFVIYNYSDLCSSVSSNVEEVQDECEDIEVKDDYDYCDDTITDECDDFEENSEENEEVRTIKGDNTEVRAPSSTWYYYLDSGNLYINGYQVNDNYERFTYFVSEGYKSYWYSSRGSIFNIFMEGIIAPQDAGYMFYNLFYLEEIHINNCDFSNTTNMECMFSNCEKLRIVDLNDFDTSNVTDISEMFRYCKNLVFIDLSMFNTSNVVYVDTMFFDCRSLDSVDISNWDTRKFYDLSNFFYNCTNLKEVIFDNLDLSKCVGFYYMFYGCSSLEKVVFNVQTKKLNIMAYMFYGCSSLTSLDLSSIDTSRVVRMEYMFYGCSSLISVDVSNFDTHSVYNMAFMFYGCSNLTSLDLSNFESDGFSASSSCCNHMFSQCSKLEFLDISGFYLDFGTSYSITSLFGCNNLKKIVTPYYCNCYFKLPDTYYYIFNNNMGSSNSWYCSVEGNYILYKDSTMLDENLYYKFDSSTGELYINGYLYTEETNTTCGSIDCSGYSLASAVPWYSLRTKIKKIIFETDYIDESLDFVNMKYWFNSLSNLTEIKINGKSKGTYKLSSMHELFLGCTNLVSVDLSAFDTSNVTNMSYMFYNCYKLESINLSNFNTSKVTNMGHMFYQCFKLKSLDLSNFSTSNVTDMYNMFNNCGIDLLDLSSFDVSNVISASYFCSGYSGNIIIAPYKVSSSFFIPLNSFYCVEGNYNTKVSTINQAGKTYYRCYNINYNIDSNTTLSSSAPTFYVYSQGLNSLISPSKEGYVFKGWYSTDSYIDEITSISTSKSGVANLYPKFVLDSKKVVDITDKSTFEYSSKKIYYKLFDNITNTELNSLSNVTIEYYIDNVYVKEVPDNLPVGSYSVRINIVEDSTYEKLENLVINDALIIEEKDISTCVINDIADQIYNGELIKPTISIINPNNYESLTLYDTNSSKGDYSTIYENNLYKGQATILITGCGNYTGTITLTFNILGKTLENTTESMIYYNLPKYIKTTSGTKLSKVQEELNGSNTDVYHALWEFIESDDLTQSTVLTLGAYEVDVVCKPKSEYELMYDSIYSQILLIVENLTPNISNLSIDNTGLLSKVYDTKSIESITFDYNGETKTITLANNDDFDIEFSLNGKQISYIPTNAGDYLMKITIPATEIYDEISIETYITISKRTITAAMIKDIEDQVYTGSQIMPKLNINYNVDDNCITLQSGIDYIVLYDSNVSGEGCVYVLGQGNYTSESSSSSYTYKYFNILGGGNSIYITDESSNQTKVTISYVYNSNLTYNGSAQVPNFEIFDITDSTKSVKLTENEDYDLSIISENITDVNTGITIKVEYKGSYSGYEFKTYNINAYTLTSSNVDSEGNVKANNTTLVENLDYTKVEVESEVQALSSNTELVKYLYTGINNYDGEFTVTLSEEIEELQYFKFKDSDTYKFSEISTGIILNEVEHTKGNKGETELYLDNLSVGTKIKDIIDLLENSSSQTTTIKAYTAKDELILSLFYKNSLITTNTKINLYDSEDNLLDSFSLIIRGDVNGDGRINLIDLDIIQASLMKIYDEFIYYIASDVNNDGKLTVKDYKLLV